MYQYMVMKGYLRLGIIFNSGNILGGGNVVFFVT